MTMDYIVHHRCREAGATGETLNIPYGSTFGTIGDFIATPEGKAICYTTSELAHKYFSRNDDGRGLERGKLTYAIAYSPRVRYSSDKEKRKQRFTDDEIRTLETNWGHFLLPDVETILFNHAFFNAEPEELAQLAKAINIKV